jgi:small nuclear ribonucleoprotein (snRNP)-like protein
VPAKTRSSLILSLAFVSAAPALADQVVLKNGDTITGSVVKKDGSKLTIHSEFLGDVTMPWTAVKSLKSDQPVTVVLPGGEAVLGKLDTAGDNLEVVTGAATRTMPLATVAALRDAAEQHTFERLEHPGILELWTGFFDTGLALARGNARTETLADTFNAARVTKKDKITINLTQIYAKALANNLYSDTANAIRGSWTYNRDVTPRFFVSTLNSYEHDQFQDLRLRFVAGGGFGVNAIKHAKTTLALSGGVDYERENFSNSISRNSGEINFGDVFTYKASASTNITQDFTIFPNLTYGGEYRMDFDVSAVTAIKKWLGWHVTATDRFLSNPVLGRLRNDVLLSTGLRLTFAK